MYLEWIISCPWNVDRSANAPACKVGIFGRGKGGVGKGMGDKKRKEKAGKGRKGGESPAISLTG